MLEKKLKKFRKTLDILVLIWYNNYSEREVKTMIELIAKILGIALTTLQIVKVLSENKWKK